MEFKIGGLYRFVKFKKRGPSTTGTILRVTRSCGRGGHFMSTPVFTLSGVGPKEMVEDLWPIIPEEEIYEEVSEEELLILKMSR
jgi:hypothetical protein